MSEVNGREACLSQSYAEGKKFIDHKDQPTFWCERWQPNSESIMNCLEKYPQIARLLKGANHVDVKIVEGGVSMRQFIASMLSYYPRWIVFLYYVRGVFVRLLGMRQPGKPDELPRLKPDDISMTPGERATFFIVRQAREEEYWIAETPEDKHLQAYFGIIVEPSGENLNRFHVVTIVHYKHWTGPVYFNTIRPFHHLVVRSMARAGISPP